MNQKPLFIASHRWGEIRLSDGRRFKDVRLWPGGAEAWDWTKTGTRHSPGIQIADLRDCLKENVRCVILSRGRLNRLRVPDALVASLEAKGLEVQVLSTDQAIAAYNEAILHQPVAALIHSTC
ncbi:MAG: MTH938/NDUFAF3 family protein [Fidelibacterota bacterium]